MSESDLFDALDGIDAILDADIENDLLGEVLEIVPEEPIAAPIRAVRMIEVMEYDRDSNLLTPHVQEEFISEVVFEETELLTEPQITTITTEGFLSNVEFVEEALILVLEPNESVVRIKCNYGNKMHPSYVIPVQIKQNNRGRKRKNKAVSTRKKQGTGDSFNSQISVTVILGNSVVKAKVFRNGRIQIPGVTVRKRIPEVIEIGREIARMFDKALNYNVIDPTLKTRLINLNPVMKNYKLHVKMQPGYIIDLNRLCKIMHECKREKILPIYTIKYRRSGTKFAVKFHTPVYKKPTKTVLFNIFMSGKINILGGLNATQTAYFCKFFDVLFTLHRKVLIVECAADDIITTIAPCVQLDHYECLGYVQNMQSTQGMQNTQSTTLFTPIFTSEQTKILSAVVHREYERMYMEYRSAWKALLA
jgi:hypothetical protein